MAVHGCLTCPLCLPITRHCPLCTPCVGRALRTWAHDHTGCLLCPQCYEPTVSTNAMCPKCHAMLITHEV